jgi:predicted extracellular nuclease
VVLVAAGLAIAPAGAQASTSGLVISQVYGGGGYNGGAPYNRDFIELYNGGASAVTLTGWSVQYQIAGGASWLKDDLAGSVGPGHYYLVGEEQGMFGAHPLPTPDVSRATNLGTTNGKVALVDTTSYLSVGCPAATDPTVIDRVGYGTTPAPCHEGSGNAPAPSGITQGVSRTPSACTDTNDNSADFSAAFPNPRNSASPTLSCPSTTTLQITKTSSTLKASGGVRPNRPGESLTASLLRKKQGRFRTLVTKHPTLNALSQYAVSFARPSPGTCKVTVKYPGDAAAKPSTASKTVAC